MFRSDLDAALQRADALQRELDSSRAQADHLQCQLTNALAQLTIVESADALQRQVHQLVDQLASTQQLLAASENERRRLEALVPSHPVKREYANPGAKAPSPTLVAIAIALWTFLLIAIAGR
jgi:chromosome segregation ATPase